MIDVDTFNKILFDPESGLLLSICTNLIFDITDPFCLKNASLLIDYFRSYNKLGDLFLWAFEKDHMENEDNSENVGSYGFFTTFNYIYSIENMTDYFKEVSKTYLDDPNTLDTIDTSLFRGNPDEFTKEMNEMYYNSIQIILQIISVTKQNFQTSASLIPVEYIKIIQQITDKINTNEEYKKKGVSVAVFNRIVKQMLVYFLKNKRVLRRCFGADKIDYRLDKIFFVADTIHKLSCNSCEPYILHLGAVVKSSDGFSSMSVLLERGKSFYNQTTEQPSANILNELVSLIRCNALPIKRSLNPNVVNKLYQSLQFPDCSLDDYISYSHVIRTIETMARGYYNYFLAVLDDAENKTKQYNAIKKEYVVYADILEEKRNKNIKLQQRLERLKKRKHITVHETHTLARLSDLSTSTSSATTLTKPEKAEKIEKRKLRRSCKEDKITVLSSSRNEMKKLQEEERNEKRKKAEEKREEKRREKEEKKRKKEEKREEKKSPKKKDWKVNHD
ncbi:Uncharacterized protein QTN25_009575 [Entamoeba marina]